MLQRAKKKSALREWVEYLCIAVPLSFAVGGVFYLILIWAGVH